MKRKDQVQSRFLAASISNISKIRKRLCRKFGGPRRTLATCRKCCDKIELFIAIGSKIGAIRICIDNCWSLSRDDRSVLGVVLAISIRVVSSNITTSLPQLILRTTENLNIIPFKVQVHVV